MPIRHSYLIVDMLFNLGTLHYNISLVSSSAVADITVIIIFVHYTDKSYIYIILD